MQYFAAPGSARGSVILRGRVVDETYLVDGRQRDVSRCHARGAVCRGLRGCVDNLAAAVSVPCVAERRSPLVREASLKAIDPLVSASLLD